MTLAFKNLLYRHKEQLTSVIDVPHALRSSSIHELDERVELKMHSYKEVAMEYLDGIRQFALQQQ